ncbi:ornithine cyclodeaminase family protein [Actinophytocola sp. NPDC049390]|uniref:ornithine cyclodeaminase family protein n=1 Tax=Actinophytocola sp. NPDC049390 TaxID=3363894 RepID=UPI0037A641A2
MDTLSLCYIDAAEVAAALATIDPVDRIRDVLALHAKGETVLPDEAYLPWTGPDGSACRSLNMPGIVQGGVAGTDIAGTKIINASLGNPDRGLPRAAGLVVLFDPLTARPRSLLDGTAISALRTAAVSVCAIEQLASATGVVALVGCGALAAAHLNLMLTRLPDVTEVRLFDRVPERAAALGASVGRDVRVVRSAEEAVRGADIVVPVTTTTEGYLPMSWLAPGAVVVNVSLDDVLPDVVHGAGLVVVDDWGLVAADDRRLLGRMLRGGEIYGPHEQAPAVPARRIDAELGEILIGAHPGRAARDDVVLVNPFGMAIADLAIAGAVERKVRQEGGGRWLPFG